MIHLDSVPLPNVLGGVALALYIATLLPTTLRVVFPQTKQTAIPKILLKHRRIIGIFAFLLALAHGGMLVCKRRFDFLDLSTYWMYFQGVSTFLIFTLLVITSNDYSVKRLRKNWKRLHRLTYLAMFLLIWHIADKMSQHFSWLTPFALLAITTTSILFLMRGWLENRPKPSSSLPQKTLEKVGF